LYSAIKSEDTEALKDTLYSEVTVYAPCLLWQIIQL